MQVRLKCARVTNLASQKCGETVTVADDEAERMFAAGLAEPVIATPIQIETAAVVPPENAMQNREPAPKRKPGRPRTRKGKQQ